MTEAGILLGWAAQAWFSKAPSNKRLRKLLEAVLRRARIRRAILRVRRDRLLLFGNMCMWGGEVPHTLKRAFLKVRRDGPFLCGACVGLGRAISAPAIRSLCWKHAMMQQGPSKQAWVAWQMFEENLWGSAAESKCVPVMLTTCPAPDS